MDIFRVATISYCQVYESINYVCGAEGCVYDGCVVCGMWYMYVRCVLCMCMWCVCMCVCIEKVNVQNNCTIGASTQIFQRK